jgi:thiol-disulfide isomerase/thioredoxin
MRLFLIACAVLALVACHKKEQAQQPTNESAPAATSAEAEPVKGVDRSHKGKSAAEIHFEDPDGDDASLAEFSGKPVLVNLWATWCAPCVKELPTLDRLSQSKGAIHVVAVSQDMAPHASVVAFLEAHKIQNLVAYQDSKMDLSAGLDAPVLPTSILFDAQGREVWRYVGDLDWTSPEAAKLLAEAGAGEPQKR